MAKTSTMRQLRRFRVLASMSLHDVAARAEIDPAHLSRIERGQANLTTAVLGRLVPVLELTPEEIAAIVAEESVS